MIIPIRRAHCILYGHGMHMESLFANISKITYIIKQKNGELDQSEV